MKNGNLTDKEIKIIDTEYEKHKHDNICPHTTNPLQLKSLCKRCRLLDTSGIGVYQMPRGGWGCSIMRDMTLSCPGIISDGFKSRRDAEQWALKRKGKYYLIIGGVKWVGQNKHG